MRGRLKELVPWQNKIKKLMGKGKASDSLLTKISSCLVSDYGYNGFFYLFSETIELLKKPMEKWRDDDLLEFNGIGKRTVEKFRKEQ